jgi:hypothetical protein
MRVEFDRVGLIALVMEAVMVGEGADSVWLTSLV